MGAKTWMLVFGDGDIAAGLKTSPPLDRDASTLVATTFFPKLSLQPLPDGTLSWTNPPDDQVFVGRLGEVTVVAANEFALDRPSQLPAHYLRAAGARNVVLHDMHSVVDWLAFAVWKDGQLQRSLSLSPNEGVIEDIGEHLAFEKPYWAGQYSADDPEDLEAGEDPYTLPFHPLDLGEAALRAFFGYQLEGQIDPGLLDTGAIALMHFQRKKKLFGRW